MSLRHLRLWIERLGTLAALATLAAIFQGLQHGVRRPAGRASGNAASWLRRPGFLVAAGLGYFGACALLWRPLPRLRRLRAHWDAISLVLGALLYFPGLAVATWGRLALGQMYFVSTTGGAQLFGDHRLVTHGPYAWVRHPMYLGLALAGLGGLLIYRTWTWVLFSLNIPVYAARARREEGVLEAEFGEQWRVYAACVPGWLPRWR
jgi:protein-S-isoprenylcysteine O-methyltransferase Ste14